MTDRMDQAVLKMPPSADSLGKREINSLGELQARITHA
jgi:hypothetical protein